MKIVPPGAISALCNQLHAAGSIIVFTHGVLDLLHPAHIEAFTEARKRGTHLIVALHTDDSARKVYGKHRPLIDLAERAEVLAALETVSYVTWFNEESPEKLISLVKPDVILNSIEDPAATLAIVEKILRLPDHSS